MSFWKNLFGGSKQNQVPKEEPKDDVMPSPPDDLTAASEQNFTDNISQERSSPNKDSPQ